MAKIAQAVHQAHTDPATLIGMDSLSHNKLTRKFLPKGVANFIADPTSLTGSNALSSAESRAEPEKPPPAAKPPTLFDDPRASVAVRARAARRKAAEDESQSTLLGPGI